MTIHTPAPARHHAAKPTDGRLGRIGGAAALLAAGTFGYGIAMFATSLADYTDPDASAAESVEFLVGTSASSSSSAPPSSPSRSHCGSDSSIARRFSRTPQPSSPRFGPRSCTRPA